MPVIRIEMFLYLALDWRMETEIRIQLHGWETIIASNTNEPHLISSVIYSNVSTLLAHPCFDSDLFFTRCFY